MLYYQLPLYFFLGAMLYVYPAVAKALAVGYVAILLYTHAKH